MKKRKIIYEKKKDEEIGFFEDSYWLNNGEKKIKKTLISDYAKLLIILVSVFVIIITAITITFTCFVVGDVRQIRVAKMPNKTQYFRGEVFDSAGLKIEAEYDRKIKKNIKKYEVDIKGVLDIVGEKIVNVEYVKSNKTVRTSFNITVIDNEVMSLEVKRAPDKLSYVEGMMFDPTNLEIVAIYNNGERMDVQGWEIDKKGELSVNDKEIIISYCGASISIPITVDAKILTNLIANSFPTKISYQEGEYFDFLGLKLIASYANAIQEEIYNFEWSIDRPLESTDKSVDISYTINGKTKIITIGITVEKKPVISEAQEQLQKVLKVISNVNELNSEHLDVIEYALQLLSGATDLTVEQQTIQKQLEAKKIEIMKNIAQQPEIEYAITYMVANNLVFPDMTMGSNPTMYKASDGEIKLDFAVSEIAKTLGYVFVGWQYNNESINVIRDVTSNITLYALFELTKTVKIEFFDYTNLDKTVYTMEEVDRTTKFNLLNKSVESFLYKKSGQLVIAYYNSKKERITNIDLSVGSVITVFVIYKEARELHLEDDKSVTLTWEIEFIDDNGLQITSENPQVGTVYLLPIGAQITMTALHANISDILIEGASKGKPLTNTIIQAEFELVSGIYPISVTFKTVLQDITTISFIGKNQKEVIFPKNWDGIIPKNELDSIAFIYNETDLTYLNIYTINDKEYIFEDLKTYEFKENTSVWVKQVYNSFSLKIFYSNGKESFNGLIGRQSLQKAISGIKSESLQFLNVLMNEKLYFDIELSNEVSGNEIMQSFLCKDIVLYSKYIKPAPELPQEPTLPPVDYSATIFVGVWTSAFNYGGNVLESEIQLSNDGYYSYRTFINGTVNADYYGQYRVEKGDIELKTINLRCEYQELLSVNLEIDIVFASDGIIRTTFVFIVDTEVTTFDHFVTKGAVKPVNYSGREFLKAYEKDGIIITLKANGTADINFEDFHDNVQYRVDGEQFWIFSNGMFGTGNITEFVVGRV